MDGGIRIVTIAVLGGVAIAVEICWARVPDIIDGVRLVGLLGIVVRRAGEQRDGQGQQGASQGPPPRSPERTSGGGRSGSREGRPAGGCGATRDRAAAGPRERDGRPSAKECWLRTFLELSGGIPSHDTLGRVFSLIDSGRFTELFMSWVAASIERTAGQVIAMDAKTARGD